VTAAHGDPGVHLIAYRKDLEVYKHITMWSLVFAVTATAKSAAPTIDQLAPENSIAVASVDKFQQTLTRLKGTPLWGLWTSEEMTTLLEEPLDEITDAIDEALAELDLEADELSWPQGSAGIAILPGSPQDPRSGPGFLAMADYGVKAPQMNRVINAVLDSMREDHQIEIPEQEILGRTVYTINLAELGGGELDLDAAEDFGIDMLPMLDPQGMIDKVSAAYYVRDGRRFMVCSDLKVLRSALEIVDEDGHSGLGRRSDFQGALGQLGTVDGYAVLLLRDLSSLMPGDPTIMMAQMMFQQIVGDIQAIGIGVRIDAGDAMVEETIGVYMPNGKKGLTSLLDRETPQGKVPAFVDPGAAMYSRFNFGFDGVMGFLRGVAATNPMIGMQLNQFLVEYGPTIDKVCSAIGPGVHSVVTITRPMKLDSLKTLYAIESRRPEDVEAVLTEYAGQMGLVSRDFLGHRIYSMNANPMAMGMGGGMQGGDGYSIAFGGGYVMLGNTSVVEDALRAAARGDMPNLRDDPAYRRALRALKAARSIGWGVIRVVDYLEYFQDLGSMANEQAIEQMKQWDPDYARELQRELADKPERPWEDFDLQMLNRYLGPVSWEVRSREDGFVGKYIVLEPEEE